MKWINLVMPPVWAWIQIMLGVRVILGYSERWWCVPLSSLSILTAIIIIAAYTIMLYQHYRTQQVERDDPKSK